MRQEISTENKSHPAKTLPPDIGPETIKGSGLYPDKAGNGGLSRAQHDSK
jgi:hypothetical protein